MIEQTKRALNVWTHHMINYVKLKRKEYNYLDGFDNSIRRDDL